MKREMKFSNGLLVLSWMTELFRELCLSGEPHFITFLAKFSLGSKLKLHKLRKEMLL